ncbi:siphovirus Gp157 family protein [Veillonella seminalis]|uniref:siphovirus Gp157 family protein n=1 Tax=Veillonella seminalis TaxID=1502943 RepID=UPI003DA3BD46
MNSLYDLSENYKTLMQMIEDAELDEEAQEDLPVLEDTLLMIDDSLEGKVDNICRLYFNWKNEAEMFKKEADRLTKRRKVLTDRVERLKTYLQENIEKVTDKPYATGLFKTGYRKSVVTEIDDLNAVPDEFKKIAITPDKTAIKNAIKAGAVIDGAHLEEHRNFGISLK